MNFDRVKAALKKRGYAVSSFEAARRRRLSGPTDKWGECIVWRFINAFGNESAKAPGIA